jgi:signal peptidase I
MAKFLSFLSQTLATFILLVGAVLIVGAILLPRLTGASTYAVLANSMAPRYPMGTLMVVRPAETIYTGDVITFQPNSDDPNVVTHRVVAIGATVGGELRFTTQGDANNVADPALVRPEQVRGVLWYAIPFAGFLVVATNNVQQHATLVAAGLLGVYAIWQVVRFGQDRAKSKIIAPAECTVPAECVVPPECVVPSESTTPVVQELPDTTSIKYAVPLENAIPDQFQPTMTRAERRRIALAQLPDSEFSLIS